MMSRAKPRKRPCKICRRWFLPEVRHQKNQKTCDDPECRREWRNRRSRKWNKKNTAYFKSIYLAKKLARIKDPPPDSKGEPEKSVSKGLVPQSRRQLNLPRDVIQDAIGVKQLIIIEYIAELIIRKYQDDIRSQLNLLISKRLQPPP